MYIPWDRTRTLTQGCTIASWLLLPCFCISFYEKHAHQPKTKEWTQRQEAKRKETFNEGLTRSGIWWAGTPRTVTTSNLFSSSQVPPVVTHWLSTMGWTIFLDIHWSLFPSSLWAGPSLTAFFPVSCALQFSSVAQSHPTLCDPVDHCMPGFPVHYHLPELTQTHVHRVADAIQPSHPLSSPSPPAFNLSQHQGLFQWVSSLHQVAKILEFQLQHQSFQWIFRTDFPLRWTGCISLQFKGLLRVFSNTIVQKHQFFGTQLTL